MTYYLVKGTQTATAANTDRPGAVVAWYYGKNQEMLARESQNDKYAWMDFNLIDRYHLSNYAYRRECDAKRAYSYRNAHNTDMWTVTVEIVAVEHPMVETVY